METIPHIDYYGRRLWWWHSASCKYTYTSWFPTTLTGTCSRSLGLHVNADKWSYMSFYQKGDISILNCGVLKLVEKFTYLDRSVSSTENMNMCLAKAWITVNTLSIVRKSNLSDKIKRNFFQAVVVLFLLYGYTTWMLRGGVLVV